MPLVAAVADVIQSRDGEDCGSLIVGVVEVEAVVFVDAAEAAKVVESLMHKARRLVKGWPGGLIVVDPAAGACLGTRRL